MSISKSKSIYSLFHKNTKNPPFYHKYIDKLISNLKENKITITETESLKKEIMHSPFILTDMPILIALFAVVVTVIANLYVPYISSLVPLVAKENKYNSDEMQLLNLCTTHLKQLQNITIIVLFCIVILTVIKMILSFMKKCKLMALYEYERMLNEKQGQNNTPNH